MSHHSQTITWNPNDFFSKYGYHRLVPVPTKDTNSQLNINLNKKYSRIRPNNHHVVTCGHQNCNHKWSDRKTYTSYSKYHKKKHVLKSID